MKYIEWIFTLYYLRKMRLDEAYSAHYDPADPDPNRLWGVGFLSELSESNGGIVWAPTLRQAYRRWWSLNE